MSNQILIPYKFEPRDYQLPLLKALDGGVKRALCLWHRRGGKDKTLWNYTIKRAIEKKGIYYYFLPTYTQAKKIIWEGVDSRTGMTFLDHCPKEITKSINNTEMKIELVNGSVIRLVGTDKFDSVRGTNPVGCVFSEYAFQDPRAWDVVRPILDENGGWAIFNTTPNGENHCYDLYEKVKDDPRWFVEVLSIEDTKAIHESVIEEARAEGVDEDTIAREYYCSFSASVLGAYYGPQMRDARTQGRITKVTYQPNSLVYTAWDLGRDDATTIWFFQKVGNEFHFFDYYENNNEEMTHYVKHILNKKEEHNYIYAQHYLPHDSHSKMISTKFSPFETMVNLGIPANTIKVVPRTTDVLRDIQASRAMLPTCYFDEENCKQGIAALRSYSKKYDEEKKVFGKTPNHDWSSHGADAFRTFAVGWRDPKKKKKTQEVKYNYLTGRPIGS